MAECPAWHSHRVPRIRAGRNAGSSMKITDVRCAMLGDHPVVRLVTDSGLRGHGPIEHTKSFIRPKMLYLDQVLLGEGPAPERSA